ncbi:MAG: hypothetical protein V4850_24420 [Myxococcota bacterium]
MPILRRFPLLALLAACQGKDDVVDTAPDAEVPACSPAFDAADLTGGTWDPRFTVAGFTGHDGLAPSVYDFAVDVDGSLVATGRFQWLGSDAIEPLARWRDGAWAPARTEWELTPELTGFSAIAIADDGALALVTYDTYGDRFGEIWVDDGTGLRSIGAFEGLVRSVAWFDGKLWVAGLYALDMGTVSPPIEGLATWDGEVWSAAPGGALVGSAFELAVDGDELLVGGAFTEVGGVAAANVAAYAPLADGGATWRAFDFASALVVYALTRGDDGELYAGGALGGNESGAGGVSRWDGAAWQIVGGGFSMYSWPGVVTDLAVHEGALHATGCFAGVGGPDGGPDSTPARSLVRLDGTSWTPLDDGSAGVLGPWLEPAVCGDEGLTAVWDVSQQRLASAGDTIFLGGSFPGAGGVLSQSIVGYTNDAWVPQGTDGLGLGGSVERLAASGAGCDLYALGLFTHAGGVPTTASLLHLGDAGWEPIDDTIPADAWCPALAASDDGDVVVGCMEFPPEGGDAVGRIYRKVGARLEPVEASLGPIFTLVYDLDGALWIGGGATTGYLARLDGDTLTVVEDSFDGPLTRIDVRGDDDVLVGGTFTTVGGVDAARIALWDGTSWSALGDGAPGMVTALARDATNVYVSTYDEGNGALLLGAYDGTTWTELATADAGLTPQSYFNFNDIQPIDGALLLVGAAELDGAIDGNAARGALVYQDGAFAPLGGAVRAMGVSDLLVTADSVWFAGSIAEVGEGPTLAPSVGIARYIVTH